MVRAREKEREREGERRDLIAGINGNNITRFRFQAALYSQRDLFFYQGKSFVFLLPPF